MVLTTYNLLTGELRKEKLIYERMGKKYKKG